MKTNGNDKTLESYKIFPIIAWVLVFGFSLFVYNITMELKAVSTDLKQQSEFLQAQAKTPVEEIEDFEQNTRSTATTSF